MVTNGIFSHQHDNWATPEAFYRELNKEFQFTLDPCPLGGSGGLERSWQGERVYCNPPYSDISSWLAKASESDLAVYLLPSRTGTKWFHEQVLPKAKQIRFIRGRLKFGGSKTNAPFDSMVVIYCGN